MTLHVFCSLHRQEDLLLALLQEQNMHISAHQSLHEYLTCYVRGTKLSGCDVRGACESYISCSRYKEGRHRESLGRWPRNLSVHSSVKQQARNLSFLTLHILAQYVQGDFRKRFVSGKKSSIQNQIRTTE